MNTSLKTLLKAKKLLNKHLNKKSNSLLDDELGILIYNKNIFLTL
jgi:hypothetical protein